MREDTFFYTPQAANRFQVTVITGTCRSGKTLLGNVLATCPSVEYADEPWTAMLLPMVVRTGKIDETFAHGWLSAFATELFNDLVLLRQANFRPDDLSSIWTKKTPDEILHRLTGLKSRDDVRQHVHLKNLSLVMTLAECGSFADVIADAFSDVRFVHVVRNGYQVATDVAEKRWFSDAQLKQPTNAQLYARFQHDGIEYNLPWWVDVGDEPLFLRFSEYERGLYYWCSLIEKTLAIQDKVVMQVIRYDELVARPRQVFEFISQSLGLAAGPLTDARIAEIAPRVVSDAPTNIDGNLCERTKRLNVRLELQDD